jgi:hypothetical protein
MNIPAWLTPYIEQSEVLRLHAQMLADGRSDEDTAQRFGVPVQVAINARKRWRLFREDECPHCGEAPYNGKECADPKCISNWVLEVPKKK